MFSLMCQCFELYCARTVLYSYCRSVVHFQAAEKLGESMRGAPRHPGVKKCTPHSSCTCRPSQLFQPCGLQMSTIPQIHPSPIITHEYMTYQYITQHAVDPRYTHHPTSHISTSHMTHQASAHHPARSCPPDTPISRYHTSVHHT